jgi:hypothetical protein
MCVKEVGYRVISLRCGPWSLREHRDRDVASFAEAAHRVICGRGASDEKHRKAKQ